MRGFFNLLLLDYLPFWKELFVLVAASAWPLSVYAVARIFRKEFASLFQRLQGVSMAGAEISFVDQQVARPLSISTSLTLKELRGVERTPAIAQIEKNLLVALEEIDENERYERAVRELAQSRLDTGFAITYSSIFGSQINLLRKIRENGVLDKLDGQAYFAKLQEDSEFHRGHDFDDYTRFLYARELIQENEGKISLTPFGNDFLLALFRLNLSTDRAF